MHYDSPMMSFEYSPPAQKVVNIYSNCSYSHKLVITTKIKGIFNCVVTEYIQNEITHAVEGCLIRSEICLDSW